MRDRPSSDAAEIAPSSHQRGAGSLVKPASSSPLGRMSGGRALGSIACPWGHGGGAYICRGVTLSRPTPKSRAALVAAEWGSAADAVPRVKLVWRGMLESHSRVAPARCLCRGGVQVVAALGRARPVVSELPDSARHRPRRLCAEAGRASLLGPGRPTQAVESPRGHGENVTLVSLRGERPAKRGNKNKTSERGRALRAEGDGMAVASSKKRVGDRPEHG